MSGVRRAVVVACALLSACAAHVPLERVAIEHNALVAKTTNEVMLLNIVRAMQRQPMHFTSLSALHGNVTLSAGVTAAATLPSAAITNAIGASAGEMVTRGAESYGPSLTANASTSPSIDIAVNDSQEFYQGFLHAIDAATVAHFLDDGWPPDLITYLLVRRVDFVVSKTDTQTPPRYREGQIVRSLINAIGPGPAEFLDFTRCYQLKAGTAQDSDTPLVALLPLTQLTNIEKLDGAPFDVSRDKDTHAAMLLRKGGTSTALELVDLGQTGTAEERTTCHHPAAMVGAAALGGVAPSGAPPFVARPARGVAEEAKPRRLEGTFYLRRGEATEFAQPRGDAAPLAVPVGVQVTLRSPEATMYFLGEYIRAQAQADAPRLFRARATWPFDADCARDADYPILQVERGQPARAVLSVHLDGATYSIPRSQCGTRSMEVITLVEQIVNLQKSSRDKIGTQSVRLTQ